METGESPPEVAEHEGRKSRSPEESLLRLLGTFFIIGGVVVTLLLGLPLISFVTSLFAPGYSPRGNAALWILLFALPTTLFLTGWLLFQERGFTFCAAMAGVVCLMFPMGTVLGVATILALRRPAVRERFPVGGRSILPPGFTAFIGAVAVLLLVLFANLLDQAFPAEFAGEQYMLEMDVEKIEPPSDNH